MSFYHFSLFYIVASCFMGAIGFILAYESFLQKNRTGYLFGLVCIGFILVDFSYLISIFSNDYLMVSISASLYFFSMDLMLFFMMHFTRDFTHHTETILVERLIKRFVLIYLVFDFVVFAMNPFFEIAIAYVPTGMDFPFFGYAMKPLYYGHLAYTYFLVALIVAMLVYKAGSTPKGSGEKYAFTCMAVILLVLINAVFLFLPGDNLVNIVDIGILLYGVLILYVFWAAFHYTSHGMLDAMRSQIFSSIGQGIVLFDYENQLLLKNDKIEQMLPHVEWNNELTTQKFMTACNIHNNGMDTDTFSMQCYPMIHGLVKTFRCDYKTIYNTRGNAIGTLFVFSDAELEIDVLTGFHTWSSYHLLVQENPEYYDGVAQVAVFDLNGLGTVNKTLGHGVGDQKIQELASSLRKNIPFAAYFVRDTEANLFAICYGITSQQLLESVQKIQQEMSSTFQYAIATSNGSDLNILQTMDEAMKGLRMKKMLDEGAAHSAVLNSMIHMLQECDMDTEEHVVRTRRLGEEMAKRMNLNDSQQSELALLCLLHDIGKIGIPLEILNKPIKLTAEEWNLLQTHVEKGSEIARNIEELQGIADSILHHHERWDGLGYPDGLRKESIPLLARIIAVVDAYDAMVHDRVYRKAMSNEQAEAELRSNAGSQFDPYIVSEFLQMLKDNPELQGTSTGTLFPLNGEERYTALDYSNGNQDNRSHVVPFSRYLLDEDYYFVEADAFFTGITGYTVEELQEKKLTQLDLIPQEDRAEYIMVLQKELAEKGMAYIEHRVLRKDGKVLYVFCYGKQYYDSAAKAGRSEILIADCSDTYSVRTIVQDERDKAQIRLSFWEDTYRSDPLTGVMNRQSFQNDTEQQLLSNHFRVMMLMVDVDNFKQYNDCFGHQEGDELLINTAQTLASALRKNDIACRMGGDEFAAAFFFPKDCPETTMRERAQQVFDKVMITLQSEQNIATVSMGAAISDEECNTFRQLYERADAALYVSKNAGRGRLSFYE